jgi:hypothetical protein
MPESLQDSITRLLRYQRAPERATKRFRGWKHNRHILPRLQTQLEMLLDAYGKFEPVVYDTQGIRDDGSDIALRYRSAKSHDDFELICFQVKSFDDLSKKAYMQELKAQRDDSFRKVMGLRYYFLVLCTDPTEHRDRVRNIMAEFRSASRTEVIEPAFAYTFLHHPKARVEALVKRVMEADDLVFRLALESLEFSSPSARALAVFLTVKSMSAGSLRFTVEQLLAETVLRRAYDELREQQALLLDELKDAGDQDRIDREGLDQSNQAYLLGDEDGPIVLEEFETQLAADLSILESDVVELDSASETVVVRPGQMRALNAVVADALARYEYDERQLLAYMFSLFGVKD